MKGKKDIFHVLEITDLREPGNEGFLSDSALVLEDSAHHVFSIVQITSSNSKLNEIYLEVVLEIMFPPWLEVDSVIL